MIAAAIWSIGIVFLVVSFYFKEKHYDLTYRQALHFARTTKEIKPFNICFMVRIQREDDKLWRDPGSEYKYLELQRSCLDSRKDFEAAFSHYYDQIKEDLISFYFKKDIE